MIASPRIFRMGAGVAFTAMLAWSLLSATETRADHYSGASITYSCQGGNLYKIYLDLYLDCAGTPLTPQSLYFSNACGVVFTLNNLSPVLVEEVSPLCPSQVSNSTCNGGTLPSFRRFRFEVTLFLSPCAIGPWKVEWFLCCRNTMVNLANVPGIYADATVQHSPGVCDSSPVFVDSGIPYVCVGEPVSYNPGVSDPDGNTMIFSLAPARFGAPAPTPATYASGYTGAAPFPGITIQPATGQLNFTPTVTGNYVVVIQVTTYDAFGNMIGTVMRDLMFVVIVCDESPPTSSNLSNFPPGLQVGQNSVGVCEGQSFCIDMTFSDANPAAVIEVTSNATALLPGSTFTVTGTNPAVARICWTGVVASLPVNVFVQGNDGACPIPNINSRSILVGDCNSALPVTLIDLQAHRGPDHVMLLWTTASEMDNREFVVERSSDGTTYDEIGRVEGAGTSYSPRDYGFKDDTPLPSIAYYRLRQIDHDGSWTWSDVVVSGPAHGDSPVFITALEHGHWWLGGVDRPLPWSLHDVAGRKLASGVAPEGGGPIGPVNAGRQLYVLRIGDGNMVGSSLLLPDGAPLGTTLRPVR
ncbi:MAG: Ig domain-containing protein [Flavobacteriales bacterium]